MDFRLRPFDAGADYDDMARVLNAVRPDYPLTPGEWRHIDERTRPDCRRGRWVAENGAGMVGVAMYQNREWMYDPAKFGVAVLVHPEHQGRGIGASLYARAMDDLACLDVCTLWAEAREDETRGLRFLADRGFVEQDRGWESRLDVTTFDFGPFAGCEERVRDAGVEIRTLRELREEAGWDRKLHELLNDLTVDLPAPEPITTPTLERWQELMETSHDLLPDGYFVAVHGDEYVGVSQLWHAEARNDLSTGLTGVRRAWRRKGIALALKLRAIAFARDHGYAVIRTDNAVVNRPMLSINERLGFVKSPVWIGFVKHLKAPSS